MTMDIARHGLWLAAALASVTAFPTAASADVSATVAVCPWEVSGDKSEIATLVQQLGLKGGAGVELVPQAIVSQALADRECELAIESLAPIALKAGAAYALLVRLKLGSRIHIAWRLVDRTGRVASPAPITRSLEVARPTGDVHAGLAELIRRFYAEEILPAAKPLLIDSESTDERALAADGDPLIPLVPRAESEVRVVQPAMAPAATSPLRWVGITSTAVGVGSLATAGAIALSTRSDQERLRAQMDEFGQLPATDDARARFDSLRQRAQLTTGFLVAGTVLTAGGALLWWLSPGKDTTVSATVLPGGAAVTAAGRF